MAKQVGPKVVCRVIGGNLGPKSPNVGRIVIVLNRHMNPKPHTVWDEIWECAPHDGKGGFPVARDHADVFGAGKPLVTIACFPTEWLLPLEDDTPPPKVQETEKDLDLAQ